jgi:hypothetical protein
MSYNAVVSPSFLDVSKLEQSSFAVFVVGEVLNCICGKWTSSKYMSQIDLNC